MLGSFFIKTFDLMWNFKSWWFHREYLIQFYKNKLYFILEIYFQTIKCIFSWENKLFYNFVAVFFELLPKYSDFVNSDNFICRRNRSRLASIMRRDPSRGISHHIHPYLWGPLNFSATNFFTTHFFFPNFFFIPIFFSKNLCKHQLLPQIVFCS